MSKNILRTGTAGALAFLRRHWVGTLLILAATLVFFWPIVVRIDSYSEGGDAMFNAWTLARDHHCFALDRCPTYADGNIYFPNEYSMLYSETQVSEGLVTLPLHWLNANPILPYNVLTIVSFFLSGWFMYLLAKRLSKGNELFSVVAGLIFEFAPHRLSGLSHLQSLCIFVLPLAVLLILKFLERPRRRYLAGLFVALLYLFFGSWYQMVFVLAALGVLLVGLAWTKYATWRRALQIGVVVALAAICTMPLALQYVAFSKQHKAAFAIGEQVAYSSNIADYGMPNNGTLFGRTFYHFVHDTSQNTYNRDSVSYHGLVLYAVGAAVLVGAYRLRKKSPDHRQTYRLVLVLAMVALAGFMISLGPLLKIKGDYSYGQVDGHQLVLPLPYSAVDIAVPQLLFIRAIGRASVLVLFVLCCFVAFVPRYMEMYAWKQRRKRLVTAAICLLVVVELMPLHRMVMSPNAYSYNLTIPPVYTYIKAHESIDNIIILATENDYPNAPIPVIRAENVLWAGYHNRNIFNGYSGYEPPNYLRDLADFTDFKADDIPKLQAKKINYVIVDKLLSKPGTDLNARVAALLRTKLYEDGRHALYKVE